MIARRTDMDRMQELVRLHRMGEGPREVARLLGMSPKTEKKYRDVLGAAGMLAGPVDVESLPSPEVLKALIGGRLPEPVLAPVKSVLDPWLDKVLKALALPRPPGPKALWDKLRREDPECKASYSAMRRLYRRLRQGAGPRPQDVAIRVETVAGEVAQVDFGYVGMFFDPDSGRMRKVWVFVMVLGHSRHQFAKLVFDQSTPTWLGLHIEAFAAFGGVPRVVVPDNLKAAVLQAAFGSSDRHAVGLNRSYRELARYYGFKVDPTPVRAPKKKGKVESGVKYLKGNFIATCTVTELPAANQALAEWVVKTAGQRVHGETGRRPLEVFEAEERAALLPLPAERFELVVWKPAKVHVDAHVEVGGKLYSVPWRTIGKRVWVRSTSTTVQVYLDETRLATHDRVRKGRASTQEEHLPEGRRDLRHRHESYWLERADKVHAEVAEYVREVFASDDALSKLRDVQAIVAHLEKFPLARTLAAVRRARFYANYTYSGIRNILRDGLDYQPLPQVMTPTANDADRPRFARQPAEFLGAMKEMNHEPV